MSRTGSPLSLAVGDVVVYASHGIGCVEARARGRGDLPETVVLVFETGLRVTLPVDRALEAVRALSGEDELEGVRRTLGGDETVRVEPWSRRFRSMQQKVSAGEVTGLAEIVRDGVHRERRMAEASPSSRTAAPAERHLYVQARKLLAAEIAESRGIDEEAADVWIGEQIGVVASE